MRGLLPLAIFQFVSCLLFGLIFRPINLIVYDKQVGYLVGYSENSLIGCVLQNRFLWNTSLYLFLIRVNCWVSLIFPNQLVEVYNLNILSKAAGVRGLRLKLALVGVAQPSAPSHAPDYAFRRRSSECWPRLKEPQQRLLIQPLVLSCVRVGAQMARWP